MTLPSRQRYTHAPVRVPADNGRLGRRSIGPHTPVRDRSRTLPDPAALARAATGCGDHPATSDFAVPVGSARSIYFSPFWFRNAVMIWSARVL